MKINAPKQPQWGGHVTTASYAMAFIFSLDLTAIAFLFVGKKILSGKPLGIALFFLAILQLAIQLRYSLNFGKEEEPKWNFWAFFFMLALLLIIVIGTLIIMANLDYHMGM